MPSARPAAGIARQVATTMTATTSAAATLLKVKNSRHFVGSSNAVVSAVAICSPSAMSATRITERALSIRCQPFGGGPGW
ncbi:hypothetical protein [Actinokineospora fastidiosa]|uniref:hypothetical protein n=1 Tax=Actinokineospora fastidiosa TaxID=1816 RepID=UPI00166F7EF5|nr:hypothetical protein [Actinokineospora fastidiosa]